MTAWADLGKHTKKAVVLRELDYLLRTMDVNETVGTKDMSLGLAQRIPGAEPNELGRILSLVAESVPEASRGPKPFRLYGQTVYPWIWRGRGRPRAATEAREELIKHLHKIAKENFGISLSDALELLEGDHEHLELSTSDPDEWTVGPGLS